MNSMGKTLSFFTIDMTDAMLRGEFAQAPYIPIVQDGEFSDKVMTTKAKDSRYERATEVTLLIERRGGIAGLCYSLSF